MNAFLLLQDRDLAAFTPERSAAVRERVEKRLRTAEFVGSVIELFGPLLADTLNVMSGGDPFLEEEHLLTLQEGEDNDPYGQPPRLSPGPTH